MKNLKVTIIQSDLKWEDSKTNIENFSNKIDNIKEDTNLIVLPEMFSTGFSMNPEKFDRELAESSISFMQKKAFEKNAIIVGSVIFKENDKYFNRLIWMQPNGKFDFYDKRHLFSFAGEDKHYSSGNKNLICKIGDWRVKPLICYDLRFPVWSRNKNDYDLLIYIANWPERRIDAWDTLLKARAIENQAYVVGVNRIGKDINEIEHSGNSQIIDPKGNVISVTKPHEENTETIELNFDELTDFRNKFRVSDDADTFNIL
jgi:predicted amidohydrolase